MIFSSTVHLSAKKEVPVIDYLAERFTYFTKSQWEEQVLRGAVVREGTALILSDSVKNNDILSYDAGDFDEPEANLAFTIIYEDDWFLGIDKPGNLLVHRAGRSFRNNLVYQLRSVHSPAYPEAHMVNRLDRDTSGVVMAAKNSAAHAALGKEFAEGRVHKIYQAICHGTPALTSIELPIGRMKSSLIDYKFCIDEASGKPAITRVTECIPIGRKYSLVTLEPVTGRTHQIRVHLVAAGAPIVGDKLYGMSESAYAAWRDNPAGYDGTFEFYRHALHCSKVIFAHPWTNKKIAIAASLPEDMKELLLRLAEE